MARKAARDGKPTGATSRSRRKVPEREAEPGPEPDAPPVQKARLNAAVQSVRDSRMIARLGQGWTYDMIASEAGISTRQAKRAVAARRKAAPLDIKTDPVEMIERTFEGYQLSIGDFEAIAAAAASSGQLANAIGAKKGANEARDKLMMLLQATGRMPQELGALRHLIDLRAIAIRMLDAVDQFDEAIKAGTDPAVAAALVRATFHEIIGIEDVGPPPDADEVPALPETTG